MLCRGEFKSEIRTKNKYWHTLRVFGIFKFTFTYSDFNGKVFHNIYIHKCDNSVFNIIIFFQYFELISKKIPIRLFLESSGWVDQSYRLWLRWQNNPWRIQTWCRRNCSYRRFLKSYVRAVGTGGPGGPRGPGGPCMALPDITSVPEVRQTFKIRTVQKPDIFLPGLRTFKNRKKE